MSWSGLIKFLTGFTLAIALLFLAGVGVTRYLMTKLSTPPPKPIFANDSPAVNPPSSAAQSPVSSPIAVQSSPVPSSPSPSPSLPVGAYIARVNEPIGLVLRDGPSLDAGRIGGLDYNDQLIVLGSSPNGEWENVRLEGSNVEGWVKAGNTERSN
jgi:hypothetical protein